MKPSGLALQHLYSCSRLRKAITTAVNEKKREKNAACCLRGLSCLALLSISFNIVNGIRNAVSQHEVRVRWAASEDIDQRVKIKPFLVPSSKQQAKK